MRVDGSIYIGSQPTDMGLVSLFSGSPNDWEAHLVMDRGRKRARIVIGDQVPVVCRDGSVARNTIICEIVEPTENELGEVPCLN